MQRARERARGETRDRHHTAGTEEEKGQKQRSALKPQELSSHRKRRSENTARARSTFDFRF